MKYYICKVEDIDDRYPNVLISLKQLYDKLPPLGIRYFAFKYTAWVGGLLADIPVPQFELVSRCLSDGLIVTHCDFERICNSDVQFIDGIIDCIGANAKVLLRLDCFDSSYYELLTPYSYVAELLVGAGFPEFKTVTEGNEFGE